MLNSAECGDRARQHRTRREQVGKAAHGTPGLEQGPDSSDDMIAEESPSSSAACGRIDSANGHGNLLIILARLGGDHSGAQLYPFTQIAMAQNTLRTDLAVPQENALAESSADTARLAYASSWADMGLLKLAILPDVARALKARESGDDYTFVNDYGPSRDIKEDMWFENGARERCEGGPVGRSRSRSRA